MDDAPRRGCEERRLALFARRGEPVQRVVEGSRDRYLPAAILGKVGKKVRNKPVYLLTPREFGQITRIAWEVVGG